MIYFPNSPVFKQLTDLIDPMYSSLEDKGYDLAELEAIHITRCPSGAGSMTLIFDTNTMPTLTLSFKADGRTADILNNK